MRRVIAVIAMALLSSVAVTTQPARAASPVAGKIVFEVGTGGPNQLFAMRPDGTNVTDLHSPTGASDGSWSPNGKQIAFAAFPSPEASDTEVFVMNADGSAVRQLTNSPGMDVWPDWFPNGRQIAFTSFRQGFPNVFVMNADGNDERALTDSPQGRLMPSVSPNGRHIIYAGSVAPDVPPTIWIINADGTGERELTDGGPWEDIEPAWSNNGRHIAFSSNRSGTFEIVVMDADGTDIHPVAPAPGRDAAPAWSPDDKQLAFTKILRGDLNIWVMNTDGSGAPTQITSSPALEGFPDWAPGSLNG